ncbi:MAG TPA: TetR/AcrR family transcriptional regulator C-terminal domain-containing protein [Solirubrobacteraceae bacterium]|nr:TetR/AcrR family transcriptional regulator C-terminal domain-containing protein [Solirubrobacteraceae bacterium]
MPSSPESEPVLPSPQPLPPPPRPPRRPARPRPTRRTALTVEAIVAAAIEVLDETGVSGLSMRGVAHQLGTGAASLYAHVSDKDELLELVFDELVGRVPLPEPDPARWREQIHEMAGDLRQILISHRDVALAGLGRIPSSPKVLEAAEVVVAVMRAGGLSDRVIALGLDQLMLLIEASAFEDSLYEARGLPPEELAQYFDEVHTFYQRLPVDRFPVLASLADPMTGPDGDERFAFGIDALLSGFQAMSRRV